MARHKNPTRSTQPVPLSQPDPATGRALPLLARRATPTFAGHTHTHDPYLSWLLCYHHHIISLLLLSILLGRCRLVARAWLVVGRLVSRAWCRLSLWIGRVVRGLLVCHDQICETHVHTIKKNVVLASLAPDPIPMHTSIYLD